MQKIYDELNSLDKRCYTHYHLSEDILMEHASMGIFSYIKKHFTKGQKVLIVSGPGNNGADGIALARLLHPYYKVFLYLPFSVKSSMGQLQLLRAKSIGVPLCSKIKKSDIIVDCLFGSGLSRPLNERSVKIIKKLNRLKGYKIACDIPSGINNIGQVKKAAFFTDITITMGGLKKSLFTDGAKEYVGKIKVVDLGVQRKLYETLSSSYLLEKKDLILPLRKSKNTHKGSFGHLCVVIGDKQGAGLLCADAGFSFGSGLITAISHTLQKIPNYVMQNSVLPTNATALCIGMGLGKRFDRDLLKNTLPKVIDADLFYSIEILKLLEQKNIVLTPHPKEFCALLEQTKIANISVTVLQENRFLFTQMFCKKYPHIVLLLKGANGLIAKDKRIYVNPFGSAVLSKGGSGDVLAGLIGSLLAQGYSPLDAAINGSLAHTIAASNYTKNNYSMTPEDLINEIKKL